MSEPVLEPQTLPPTRKIDGVSYVLATDAAKYLGCSYATVVNKVHSLARHLVGLKIGSTLFITLESLEAEKARRDAKSASKAVRS
jgi:predicted thioesterase